MLTAVTGALAGLFHVLAGADHLAAVAPLALTGGQRRGWVAGWTWGLGHASGVVVVAIVAVILRDQLPPIDTISAWSERLVGGGLIAIGLWALRHSARVQTERHAHGPLSHDHLYVHAGPIWLRRVGHPRASFCMGVLHGVAGSSHFFGVLPALALPTQSAAFVYIAAFGVGTILAMTGFAAAIGSVGIAAHQGAPVNRAMMFMAALLAIGTGGWWLVVGG